MIRRYSLARAVGDHADAELVVDHVVDDAAVAARRAPAPRGRARRAAGRRRSPAPSCRRWRAGRRSQAAAPRTASAVVSAMCTNGIVDRGGDRVGELVHRVRAEHEQLGAGRLQRRAPRRRAARRPRPSRRSRWSCSIVGEVDRAQQAVGRVQAAEPVARGLVDQPVVLGRGLPAHAAQQPDALHDHGASPDRRVVCKAGGILEGHLASRCERTLGAQPRGTIVSASQGN